MSVILCCSCDRYYATPHALECGVDRGTVEPCPCECHHLAEVVQTIWGEFELGGEG